MDNAGYEYEVDEPDFDGDPCTHCGGQYTIRMDTICDDPLIWVCHCLDCEQWFDFAVGVME